jgi:Kip1 ubiquitination-promoting complex protein 1
MNRTMILAPILGIMLNILGSVGSNSESCYTSLTDLISVFCSMDCPATLHFGFQFLLNYNWVSLFIFICHVFYITTLLKHAQ